MLVNICAPHRFPSQHTHISGIYLAQTYDYLGCVVAQGFVILQAAGIASTYTRNGRTCSLLGGIWEIGDPKL